MVAKIIAMLILYLPCVAQDFEPDRRPEESMYFALSTNSGSGVLVGAKQSGLELVGTAAGSYDSRAFVTTFTRAYLRTPWDAEYGNLPVAFSFWYKPEVQHSAFSVIVLGYNSGGLRGLFDIYQDNGSSPYMVPGTSNYGWAWAGPFTAAQWNHFFIYRTSNSFQTYINGSLVHSATGISNWDGNSAYLQIASNASNGSGGGVGTNRAQGRFYDVRLYTRRTFTATDVQHIYQSSLETRPQ